MPPSPVEAALAALAAQCPPAARLPEAEASSLPIHVERFGAGPVVLIVHGGVQGGIGGGPATHARQQDLAPLGWQVAIVDRPGFGRSPSRGPDDMAADAAWIADMLGDGVHLVGHSWGGACALLAAARRPGAVRSLTLVEPALHALAMTDPDVQADPARRAAVMQLGQVLLTAQTPRDYARAFMASMGPTGAGTARNVGDLDDAAASRLGCAMLQARHAPLPALREAAAVVAAAAIPVLVVDGGWSPGFGVVADVAARATGGRRVTVASPNHFPQAENPEGFNATLDAFLRTVT